jgi:hypothetical protein
MAFQARRQRQVSTSRAQLAPTATAQSSLAPSLFTPDTEEWVVFSPSAVAGSSEVASILTASSPVNERHFTDFPTASDDELELEVEEEEEAEEDEEVESSCALTETDSLQPFRDGVHAPILLPTHNGLGMFQSTTTSRSFEESLRLAAQGGPTDTHSRIQKWRLEQGSVFMDEIEKATRRRRESLSRRSTGGASQLKLVKSAGEEEEAIIASLANLATPEDELSQNPLATRSVRETQGAHETLGSVDEPQTDEELEQEKEDRENETFWTRITRTFIRDIIGIDDRLLEVILGETLPNTPTQAGTSNNIPAPEDRILSRIAKELGELVHLYTHPADSPPAFTAAAVANRTDIEDGTDAKTPIAAGEQTKQSQRPSHQRTISTPCQTPSSGIHFLPTLPAAEFNLLEENPAGTSGTHSTTPSTRRQDYWEQDLDVRLVFSFLKSKFNGLHRSRSSTSVNTIATANTVHTASTTITAAAAAVSTPVHLQHPLIDRRRHPGSLRTGPVEARVDSPQVTGGYFSNPGSCARSERTRSGRASTRRGGYYWEVASSVSGKTGSCAGVGMWAAI